MAICGLSVGLGAFVSPAQATDANDQVCEGLDSGKIDTDNSPATVTVTAPDGYFIDEYCVKAGSIENGNGPVYMPVDPPVKTLTFDYPGGKAISHYSVGYVAEACPNLPGDQLPGSDCTPPVPPVDVCPNMPGDQPPGTVCTTPPPPPATCPPGTTWMDTNGNGTVDDGECYTVTPVTVTAPKKANPCGWKHDRFWIPGQVDVYFTWKGVRQSRGWHKTHGAHRVVLRAHASFPVTHPLVGKTVWAFKYPYKKCSGPTLPPGTGERTLVHGGPFGRLEQRVR
jgi:hypothetical protein